MTDTGVVYKLKDPTSGETRYVGQTTNLKQRMSNHFAMARSDVVAWIRNLIKNGGEPEVEVVERVDPEDLDAAEAEVFKKLQEDGADLLNSHHPPGFSGYTGYSLPDELAEKIDDAVASGSYRSPTEFIKEAVRKHLQEVNP